MKYILSTSVVLAFVFILFTGCKKDDSTTEPSNQANPPTFSEKVEKKWNVGANVRTSGSASDYTSFEFTDHGTYYIIKADNSFLRGDYTLNVGDSTVLLNGVGTVYIDEITDTEITFRLVLTGTTDEIAINATPATTVSVSTSTHQLTNTTWSFKARSINGTPATQINDLFTNGTYYLHVTMSDYGTYSVETNVPNTPNSVGIWSWCNTNETTFSTSTVAGVQPTCGVNSTADVSFDTNSNLVLTSVLNGQTNVDTYVALP